MKQTCPVYRHLILLFIFCVLAFSLSAQKTVIRGRVIDLKTGEPVAFATLKLKGSPDGGASDFEGYYEIVTWGQVDSITFSFVGYLSETKPVVRDSVQEINFYVKLEAKVIKPVTVSAKVNKAIRLIKNAQKNKEKYNVENLKAYECENFTKIQIAVNNVSEDLKNKKLLKQVEGIFDTISYLSEDKQKQVLPIFISESLSDFYYQTHPRKQKEVIKATRIKGVGVEDGSFLSQLLGSTFQQYNFNTNTLQILDKNFVSPIANSSLLYYNYRIEDFDYPEGSLRCIYQIKVTPKNPLDLAFTGYIWIEDSSFALRRLSLTITNTANINFVEKLKITQELEPMADGSYMPVKNRVSIDIAELSKKSPGMVALFSSSNKHIIINQVRDAKFFDYPMRVNTDATQKSDEFWDTSRHEKLSNDEKRVLAKIDTLTNVPIIKTYVEVINIIFNGYKTIGKLDFGPYALVYGYNVLEGNRFRLGAKTNAKFSKKFVISGYGAYGLLDERWKYKGQLEGILNRKRWTTAGLSYRDDVEQIGVTDDYYGGSNLFTQVSVFSASQLNRAKDSKVWFTSEFRKGWNIKLIAQNKEFAFEPVKSFNFAYGENLADTNNPVSDFTNSAVTVGLRYAPKEYYLQNDNERVRMSEPGGFALSLNYTRGIKGILGSRFNYNRITASVEKGISFGYWGRTDITLSGTKIFEPLPYPILEVHRGNQSFVYSSSAYNLMNFFEFVTDQSVALRAEHHFDGAILNRIPLMKKLKWREFVEFRGVMGTISDANLAIIPSYDRQHNAVSSFYRINKEPYMEAAYGFENVFKVLQVVAVHRLSHLSNPNARRFGVKIGFNLTF